MLDEMGVEGVKISELYSLDEVMLAMLPQPVHALIFLFHWKEEDEDRTSEPCPEHVWFANQITESNCGTVAMLNIVNNIPGLTIGNELKRFKEATQPMSPYYRGDALDQFTFIKRIHNSFASTNDMLEADLEIKEKAAAAKRKEAAKKAKATKAANAAAAAGKATEASKTPPSSSPPTLIPPLPTASTATATKPASPAKRVRGTEDATVTVEKAPKKPKRPTKAALQPPAPPSQTLPPSSPLPATAKPKAVSPPPFRRSIRVRKPRGSGSPAESTAEDAEQGDPKYHFIAYLPVGGRVWKLDGLNRHPQDLGAVATSAGWMEMVAPLLQARMAQYAKSSIGFNLLAVVHDPMIAAREALLENVAGLRGVERALGKILVDWGECVGVEEGEGAIVGACARHEIAEKDVEDAEVPAGVATRVAERADDILGLLELRRGLMRKQGVLRADVRDLVVERRQEQRVAGAAREDFTEFVHEWLAALAGIGQLTNVLASEAT